VHGAVHPAELTTVILLWILAYALTYLLVSSLRADPLIGWSIGPFGISTIFLREPSWPYRLLQLFLPAIVAALVMDLGLFHLTPPPIPSLPHTPAAEVPIAVLSGLAVSSGSIRRIVRDLRYPLWGEARMLHTLHHVRSLGGKVFFTAFGRIYVREAFGTTPQDFLQAL
jgi:hypothetical protein